MKKFMAILISSVIVFCTFTTTVFAEEVTTPEDAVILAEESSPELQTMSVQTMLAIRGQFTDFFPDPNFAKVVAQELSREATDQVTLFELQSVRVLSFFDRLSYNTEGIGLLMSLKTIRTESSYDEESDRMQLVFTDDIANCFNLEKIILIGIGPDIVHFPDAMAETSLSVIELYDSGITHARDAYAVTYGDAIIEKILDGSIEVLYGYNSNAVMLKTITVESGKRIDIANVIPESLRYNFQKYESIITVNENGEHLSELSIYDNLELFEQKVNTFLNEFLQLYRTPGQYTIRIAYYLPDGGIRVFEIPVVVTVGPDLASLEGSPEVSLSFDGKYLVSTSGLIEGYFNEGVNTPDKAWIDTQLFPLWFQDVQTGIGYSGGTEHILGMTITKTNGYLTHVVIVGIYGTSMFMHSAAVTMNPSIGAGQN